MLFIRQSKMERDMSMFLLDKLILSLCMISEAVRRTVQSFCLCSRLVEFSSFIIQSSSIRTNLINFTLIIQNRFFANHRESVIRQSENFVRIFSIEYFCQNLFIRICLLESVHQNLFFRYCLLESVRQNLLVKICLTVTVEYVC